ncbi:50S ribosomal protein L21e [Candidatus Micrarchaeota archaeon]|nr:50S ribosomal protein L21e [Candidatus Micrarchaeota archaeon]
MAKNSRGTLSGNTKKLKKKKDFTINDRLKTFSVGDSVRVSVKPGRKGAPHLRYQSRVGKVTEKRGSAYVVQIKDGRSIKSLVASSLHLEKA